MLTTSTNSQLNLLTLRRVHAKSRENYLNSGFDNIIHESVQII